MYYNVDDDVTVDVDKDDDDADDDDGDDGDVADDDDGGDDDDGDDDDADDDGGGDDGDGGDDDGDDDGDGIDDDGDDADDDNGGDDDDGDDDDGGDDDVVDDDGGGDDDVRACAVEMHMGISQEPFCVKLQGKWPRTPSGTLFCASLRSRNAHGHFARAILYGIFTGKMPNVTDTTSIKHRAYNCYRKNLSVLLHCLGNKFKTPRNPKPT